MQFISENQELETGGGVIYAAQTNTTIAAAFHYSLLILPSFTGIYVLISELSRLSNVRLHSEQYFKAPSVFVGIALWYLHMQIMSYTPHGCDIGPI